MKLGFIGVGKITTAIVEGLCTSAMENVSINLSPRNEENATNLALKYTEVKRLGSNQDVLDQSDIVFIAVTPATVGKVLADLTFSTRHTVISLVPLLKYADLSSAVYPATNLSRAIPLPPVINHNCPLPVFNATSEVIELFSYIGQPLVVADEDQLHTLWTLTGLVTPFFDLLGALSTWTIKNGVDKVVANQYIANLFQSLSFMSQQADPIDFAELAKHAATPNGMNEQAGKEIREKDTHGIYTIAADNLLKRFK
jgi:pyrroline-5-carboxylate reductase